MIREVYIPEIEWFSADKGESDFTLKNETLPGSVEVMINGLIEPSDVFSVNNRRVTVLTKLNRTDQVIVKYRRPR